MPATHTLNISDHETDPYLRDYMERRAQGIVSPTESANHALMQADLCATIVAEQGDDLDKAQAEAVCERVALAASACAKAERIDEPELAKRFSETALTETLILASFDYVNVG